MTVTAIDTHEVVKELKAAGFTDDQAEAVTRVVRRAQDIDLSALATKADLRETELRLEAAMLATKVDLEAAILATKVDIKEIEFRLKAGIRETELRLEVKIAGLKGDIESARHDLIRWVFGAVGFQALVTIGAAIALAKVFAR